MKAGKHAFTKDQCLILTKCVSQSVNLGLELDGKGHNNEQWHSDNAESDRATTGIPTVLIPLKQVICFTSTFAADRNDLQLAGVPLRFIATDNFDSGLINELKKLEWERLEKRQFPAPAVLDDKEREDNGLGILYLPGGGITLRMFEECQENGIPFMSLIMFASEGDNTPEAFTMFEAANTLFSFSSKGSSNTEDIKIPLTWGHFHGRSHPVEMY